MDELKNQPSRVEKCAKVLLMGRHAAGKTSMRSIIFAKFLARDTSRLHPTNEIDFSDLKFLGNLKLNIWDCGGQDTFMQNYLGSQKQHVFRNVQVLIYVIACSANIEESVLTEDLETFHSTILVLKDISPHAPIFVLIHKMDLIDAQDRHKVFQAYQSQLSMCAYPMKIRCFPTSIWNESLFKAWSTMVSELVPNIGMLRYNLRQLADTIDADELVIYERSTFLVICTVTLRQLRDTDRFERISHMVKQFKLSAINNYNGFESMSMCETDFNVILERFTQNTYIMILSTNPDSTQMSISINIDSVRSYLQNESSSHCYSSI